jgi:BirA family transcriptional regulator, biotin operon repressor / biotin---[acetyl-CoA-carboxylase] ligase
MERAQVSDRTMISVRALILKALRVNQYSPSELSALLKIPPQELHAEVRTLNAKGFDISLHPLLGFELHTEPKQLTAEQIESYLTDPWPNKIQTLSTTHSTNTLAFECGMQGETGTVAFFAETQTAGRGRFGRVWESDAGEGLWMSLLLRPSAPTHTWPRVTTLAALAIAESIETVTPLKPQIKWPNDVMCGGKKVAGILAETGSHPHFGGFIVLGIGVNVNQEAFPPSISNTACSLRLLTGVAQNRPLLAAKLLTRIRELLGELETGFPMILNAVRARSSVLGKTLSVNLSGSSLEGLAVDLDHEGGLILRLANGSTQTLNVGEVTLRV